MSYDSDFYARNASVTESSARVIVPLLLELVQPRSVVDVGCGVGTWLRAFKEAGVADLLGLDGSVDAAAALEIRPEQFQLVDLTRPLEGLRRYDLAVCLEVAEHLRPEDGQELVASLCRLAPVVAFSAAVPGQGGNNHVNEKWPSHWAAQFTERGYAVIDPIRRQIWSHPKVAFWYAQNLIMFAHTEGFERWPALRQAREQTSIDQLDLVHPHRYLEWIEWATHTPRYPDQGGS